MPFIPNPISKDWFNYWKLFKLPATITKTQTMKSLLLTATICLFLTATTFAQTLGKIEYGIKGGYSYVFSDFSAAKTNGFSGGYAGVMMKIPFDNRLFFTPQIDFNYRGMQTNALPLNTYSKLNEVQFRLMPVVQIDLKHPSQNENTLFIMTGPSLGFGLIGKQTKQDGAGVPTNAKLRYGYQHYGMYDASWHAGLGYETTSGLRILIDYTYGLGNMINTDEGPSLRYHTVSAGIGYWFGRKK